MVHAKQTAGNFDWSCEILDQVQELGEHRSAKEWSADPKLSMLKLESEEHYQQESI